MTRWYEAANEASFKTVAEGYVFQSPHPWIFARPRYYLVDHTQKAEILARLGRWRLLMLISVLTIFVLMGSFYTFLTVSPPTFVPLLVALLLGLMMCAAVPQIYLIRALRPLLADARRTRERIKLSEQLPKIAASISTKVLVVGMIGGLAMIAGSVLELLDTFLASGHLAGSALYSSSILGAGLLTSYFIYLVRLKAKLQRTAL
jgi:hypothetical protein